MTKLTISRRKFLKTSALTATAAVALVASGAGLNGRAWALMTSNLSDHEAATLLAACRRFYPHDGLGDMYYAACVESLDGKAGGDAGVAGTLKDGVVALDAHFNTAFVDLSDGNQLEAIEAMDGTPFFNTVRGDIVVSLYNNPLVWRHFGYEGASFDDGGYLERGFNDIGWLPQN